MKTRQIFYAILLSVMALVYVSCNEEEDNTLRFVETAGIVDNSIEVLLPNANAGGTAGAVTITGGDGNYSVFCDNPSIVEVDKKYPNAFILYPKAWGDAHVIVIDGTKQSIILNVHVVKYEEAVVVKALGVGIIEADDQSLTEEEKEQIRKEALATLPVKKVGGGYYLVKDDVTDYTKGTLTVYPDEYGQREGQIAGTFSFTPFREGDDWTNHQFKYIFTVDGKEHVFFRDDKHLLLSSRTDAVVSLPWLEDVSELFQDRYPGIKVYTQQFW